MYRDDRRIDTDFTNEEGYLLSEGEHIVTVEDAYAKDSKEGRPMVVFELRANDKTKLWFYCPNEETKRWKLKKTLHAILGEEQPKGPVSFFPSEVVGKKLKVIIFHDEYQGKKSAKVKDVVPGDFSHHHEAVRTQAPQSVVNLSELGEDDLPF